MEYTVLDVIMHIHYRESCFLKIDTMEIVNPFDYLKKYLPENPNEEDYQKLPSLESLHIYPLPSYEFICHKEIMSWYVKEMVEDKEFRKKLFSVLKYHDYMDKFYEVLESNHLYDEFRDFSFDYYYSVFKEWCKEREIPIEFKS